MADKEKYFIPIEGKLIEVEKNVYVAYYKMDRRERYLEERDRDNGVVSYNTIDSQGIDGESGLQDVVTETMETIALANELRNQLHRCIAALPRAERELIHAIYFEGMTEAEYAVKNKGRWPSGKETIKMPIMLTGKDGPPTPFRNAEYIPFYYFIPKSILSRCGAELNAIPRNPQVLLRNRAACEFVESDLFQLLIIDATAFMVWPYMGFGEYMEIYSGYDPAWRFAHCPDYWIQELTDEGILASAGELFKGCHSELGYVPEWQIDIYLRYIVPNVMKKHRMDEIIQVAREYPCFEDFDFRKSNQKTDFIRQWYHTRTKHPMISLEEFQEAYVTAEKKESKLQKAVDTANKLIAKLKAEIDSLKQEISDYKSVHSKLRAAELERENTELRGKVRSYEDVIQRNNLWRFFHPLREKAVTRDEAR